MKKRLCGFLIIGIILLSVCSVTVFAQNVKTDDIKIDIPESFMIINNGNISENMEYLHSIN
ncbi:MAG: hypothetical protein KBS52_02050, partial [Clostridiales bacterium]|nr:hypothetical protein [Candidatus Equinaster intestinalis]